MALPSGDSVEYLIDGQNRRVGRKLNGAVTHRWLYQNQLNPVAELDSAGNLVSRFVYGSRANVPDYLVKGSNVYRLITDHLGSVRAVVDTATGTVAQWVTYDAWGNVLADSGAWFQPFGFAGGLADSVTGLVRFGAREYYPVVGRWTAKDPIGFLARGPSLFAYVDGDPVNSADPTGLIRCGQTARGIFGAVAAAGFVTVATAVSAPVVVVAAGVGAGVTGLLAINNLLSGLGDFGPSNSPAGPFEVFGWAVDKLSDFDEPLDVVGDSQRRGALADLGTRFGSTAYRVLNGLTIPQRIVSSIPHTTSLTPGSPFGPLSERIPAMVP